MGDDLVLRRVKHPVNTHLFVQMKAPHPAKKRSKTIRRFGTGHRTHSLKIEPEYFEPVISGAKPFEIRFNDRNFQAGDSVILKEYVPDSGYTGRHVSRQIGYITDFEQKEGYVVFSLLK
ncbi:ASCH/PUA domain-containing protein [Sporolactobacillus sp. KGMB 08714]|uniref:ASCH/PUA domain-containing protein n=1 Tax=Sporolactobacillus sp. KGMB 08714 TaxID=3064704 RepID=UPI002FBE83D1